MLKITLFFLIFSNISFGQLYKNRGLKVGLVYEIGQPVHRIGGSIGLHVNLGSAQVSSNHTLFYAFRNYGPKIARLESQSDLSLGLGFGQAKTSFDDIALLSPISNFGPRTYLLSYGIKLYSDKIGTDQLTGLISFRMGDYFLASENDGFVFLPWDQFRTGAISVGRFIQNNHSATIFQQQQVSVDVLLYTGKTQGNPTQKISESNYPSRFGYKKLNTSAHYKASHGILKLSWSGSLIAGQQIFADIGLDNEKIRNVVQNKLIHDLPFLPKKIIKIENPHIPMRNEEGADYLFQKGEKIRKGKFVWGFGLNRPLFY
jgi:hypothetical protein